MFILFSAQYICSLKCLLSVIKLTVPIFLHQMRISTKHVCNLRSTMGIVYLFVNRVDLIYIKDTKTKFCIYARREFVCNKRQRTCKKVVITTIPALLLIIIVVFYLSRYIELDMMNGHFPQLTSYVSR